MTIPTRGEPRPLRRNGTITILATGEAAKVRVVGKNSFQVVGHALALLLSDEGGAWERGHGDAPIVREAGK